MGIRDIVYRLRYLPFAILAICALIQIVRPLFVLTDPVSTDYVEMMVAWAVRRMADGAGLVGIYQPPGAPYGMPGVAYPPLVLLLGAALVKAGADVLIAMRLICWMGYVVAGGCVGLLVWHETRSRWAAIVAALMPFCFWNVLQYLAGSRVDSAAIALALAGVACYRRGAPLLLPVLLLAAAFYCKQTMLAAPAAIALDLFFRQSEGKPPSPRPFPRDEERGTNQREFLHDEARGTSQKPYRPVDPPSLRAALRRVRRHGRVAVGQVGAVRRLRATSPFVFGMAGAVAAGFGLFMLLSGGTMAGIYDGGRAARLIPFDKMLTYWFFFVADHLPFLALAGAALWLRWRKGDRFWAFYTVLALLLTSATLLKDGAVDYYFGEVCYIVAVQVGWLVPKIVQGRLANSDIVRAATLRRVALILLAVQAVIGLIFVPKGDPATLHISGRGAYNTALAAVREAQTQGCTSLILANNLLLATGRPDIIGDYFVYGILLTSGKRDPAPLVADISAHKYDVIMIETGGFGRYPDAVTDALARYYTRRDIVGSEPGSIPYVIYS